MKTARWWREIVAEAKEQNDIDVKSLPIHLSADAQKILELLAYNGKRGLVVGGAVRDSLMGYEPKDIDIEVYGFSPSPEFLIKGEEWDDLAQRLKYTNPQSPEHKTLDTKFQKVRDEYNALSPLQDLANFLRQQPKLGSLAESEGGTVGKSFGIIKFRDTKDNEYDFSLPRTESKTGAGHTGFRPVFGDFTPEQAASRRDFTFNSMAYDPLTAELHDYFGGQKDLKNKIIRHTSPAFVEDPLRVLRGMQFAARFGFDIAPETAALSREMMKQFAQGKLTLEPNEYRYWNGKENVEEPTISRERIAEEFMKFATKGRYPAKILNYLVNTGWIDFFMPLKNIVGLEQDSRWHPEGTVDAHTGHTMDAAVQIADRAGLKGDDRATLILAALTHDLGKATTTTTKDDGSIHSYKHDKEGGPLAEELLTSLGIKKDIIQKVRVLVENHMRHVSWQTPISDKTIYKLAHELHQKKATIEMLVHLIEADMSGRPPLPKGLSGMAQEMHDLAKQKGVLQQPLQPLVAGQDILSIRPDIKPGPIFSKMIEEVLAKQKVGQIKTKEQALEYLNGRISRLPADAFHSAESEE